MDRDQSRYSNGLPDLFLRGAAESIAHVAHIEHGGPGGAFRGGLRPYEDRATDATPVAGLHRTRK